MPNQDESGLSIKIIPENHQQHFRLLELPPELLDLLTSDHAPILQLKSKPDSSGNSRDANVVLCTPDKTYNIRQVSTSNSVYITQPSPSPSSNDVETSAAGVDAVAKCDSTIELLPMPTVSATPYIKSVLPVYSSTGNYGTGNAVLKPQLFTDIPLSGNECEQSWSDLACFESKDPQGCFIPSAKVRAEIWTTLTTAAIAAGIDLSQPFSMPQIAEILADLERDWPQELLLAVLSAVSHVGPGNSYALEEEKCICFVGLSLLEARSEGKTTPLARYLQAWKDAVPEKWREKCELSRLVGHHTLADGGKSIIFMEDDSSINGNTSGERATASFGVKRKWHEKFRASKKS